MVTYAIGCGIGPMAAVSVYGVAGLSGPRRPPAARARIGQIRRQVGAGGRLFIQAIAAGAYVFVSELGEFYALGVVFALAYGGVMPLYARWCANISASRSWARCSARFGAGELRHGARAARRRLGVRQLRRLWLALHRLVCYRASERWPIALTFKPVPQPPPLRAQPA
jgi:hypothetical protein